MMTYGWRARRASNVVAITETIAIMAYSRQPSCTPRLIGGSRHALIGAGDVPLAAAHRALIGNRAHALVDRHATRHRSFGRAAGRTHRAPTLDAVLGLGTGWVLHGEANFYRTASLKIQRVRHRDRPGRNYASAGGRLADSLLPRRAARRRARANGQEGNRARSPETA